jgi:hypothetical protein
MIFDGILEDGEWQEWLAMLQASNKDETVIIEWPGNTRVPVIAGVLEREGDGWKVLKGRQWVREDGKIVARYTREELWIAEIMAGSLVDILNTW